MREYGKMTSETNGAEAIENLVREERAAALALVDELLTGPPAWWRTRVFQQPLTYGLAMELVERAVRLLNAAPAAALEASAIAVAVAERLPVEAYPYDLVMAARANAWREHAYTLFYTGRLNEAVKAVDVAEQLLRQLPEPELELARTALVRASLLRAFDRLQEALPLAQQAAEVFRRHGDGLRYVKARHIEGNLRYQSGDVAGALALWLELEKDGSVQDTEDLGLLLHNIGYAYRDLREFTRAREYLDRAIAEYAARGMEAETVRTRWVVGEMLVLAGERAEGLPILHAARSEFERLGMELEAGVVGLEIAEALLLDGHNDEVARICRTILDRFVRQGMMSRAVTALAYLREALAVNKATPALLRDVRAFLRALPNHPVEASTPASN